MKGKKIQNLLLHHGRLAEDRMLPCSKPEVKHGMAYKDCFIIASDNHLE